MKVDKEVLDKKIWNLKVIIPIIFIVLICIGGVALTWSIYEDAFGDRIDTDSQFDLYLNQSDFPDLDFVEQTFPTDNGNQLSSWIYYKNGTNLRKNKISGLIVLSHGMGDGHHSYLPDIKALVEAGYIVFAFDNTGCAKSDGAGVKGFPQSIIDLDNALKYIGSDSYLSTLPVGVYGHSWGGYSAMNILHKDYPIKAVIERSGPITSKSVFMSEAYKEIGGFSKLLGPFVSLIEFVKFGDVSNYNAVEAINGVNIPVLLMHSRDDSMIPIEISPIIEKSNITNPKVEFRIFEDRGHDFLMSDEASEYQKEVLSYLNKLKGKYEKIPSEVKQEFINSVDKSRLNEIDLDIMTEMIAFLNSAFK